MAFEAEITQSIRELQNAVAALSAKTKEANAGLKQANQSTRELATSTQAAAQRTREHETQVRQLGKVAKETGGAGGRMVKEFSEMASFTPTALAAGAAIGIVASAAAGLTAELQRAGQAQREILRLSGEVDKEVRAAGGDAMPAAEVVDAVHAAPVQRRATPIRPSRVTMPASCASDVEVSVSASCPPAASATIASVAPAVSR